MALQDISLSVGAGDQPPALVCSLFPSLGGDIGVPRLLGPRSLSESFPRHLDFLMLWKVSKVPSCVSGLSKLTANATLYFASVGVNSTGIHCPQSRSQAEVQSLHRAGIAGVLVLFFVAETKY